MISSLVVIQTLTHFSNNKKDIQWNDRRFAALCLSHTVVTMIGLVIALIAAKVASYPRDIFDRSVRYSPRNDCNNIGMLACGLLAGGMGSASLGLLNFGTFGFPTLVIAAIVRHCRTLFNLFSLSDSLH